MQQYVVLFAAMAVVVVAYRSVAAWCRRAPGRRPWFIVASVAGLGLVALLYPWVWALKPPLSESPAGLFVILGKGTIVFGFGLAAIGSLLGAVFPGRPGRPDPES